MNCIDQSEASIQVTGLLLANKRPVFTWRWYPGLAPGPALYLRVGVPDPDIVNQSEVSIQRDDQSGATGETNGLKILSYYYFILSRSWENC